MSFLFGGGSESLSMPARPMCNQIMHFQHHLAYTAWHCPLHTGQTGSRRHWMTMSGANQWTDRDPSAVDPAKIEMAAAELDMITDVL